MTQGRAGLLGPIIGKEKCGVSEEESKCHLGKWDDFRVSIVNKVDLDVAGSWIGVGHCRPIPHSVSIPELI